MPHSKCPACRSIRAQSLEGTTKDAMVDYYRCADCGHVWSLKKDTPDAEPRNMTPLPDSQNSDSSSRRS
jgi:transposase-like protein